MCETNRRRTAPFAVIGELDALARAHRPHRPTTSWSTEIIPRSAAIGNLDGSPLTDGQTSSEICRVFRRAGLPERGWHSLRHSFGTHAALLGVNPWRLQAWMGHGRIDETMLYVHVAAAPHRPLPPELCSVAGPQDPDDRILHLLGCRASVKERARGTNVAQTAVSTSEGKGF